MLLKHARKSGQPLVSPRSRITGLTRLSTPKHQKEEDMEIEDDDDLGDQNIVDAQERPRIMSSAKATREHSGGRP